jgi:uncharacterized protein (DUF1800 family)
MADWHEPLPEEQRAWHLLNRVTFGPRPGDVARVEKMGAKAFLDEQLHPERIDDAAVERKIAGLPTLSMSSEELAQNFPAKNQAQQQAQARAQESGKGSEDSASAGMARPDSGRDMAAMQGPGAMQEPEGPRRITVELAREQLWRAIYSQRQLEEVMVQFWMNHFNIFAGKGADRWLISSFERQAIRPHALGKFEDLLIETAKSPAMLFYLDNWLSVAPYTTTEGSVYRPLAKLQNRRGLNENYARELMELHTLGVEGGYTQHDVREVARCFTGWTINRPLQGGSFFFNPRFHDFGEKVVLQHKIKPGGGEADGHEVLHLLAHHPSTAHFISLKLCRRFVADDPPASVVIRAGKAFLKSKGDIRAVLLSIVTSPEFNSSAAFRAKVKSPFELVASSLRALDGRTDAGPPLLAAMVRMGQPLFYYQAPTGFPDRGSAWINSGTLLQRINFATLLAANRIRGTQVDFEAVAPDSAPNEVAKELSDRLVGGELSTETRQTIVKTVEGSEAPGVGGPWAGAALKVAAVLVASPDFQRR